MDILTVPNDILNKPTRPVTDFDENLRKTVRKMEEILKNQRDPEGVGLSANQIGLNLRLAVVRLNPEESDSAPHFLAIANPKIVSQSPTEQGEYEACLSVPNQYGMVERASAITIQFQGLKGETLTIKAAGFLARIFQHEIDHLNGKLISEKIQGKLYTEEELGKLFEAKRSRI